MKKTIYWTLVLTLFLTIQEKTIATAAEKASAKPAFEPAATGVMRPNAKPQKLTVNLNGASDLYLVATFADDSYDSDQAIWAEPTLFDADGNAVRLTTIAPANAKTGWGTLLIDKNHQGKPLSIAGKNFAYGFWAHAPSILHFKLDGKYTRFETHVGLDAGSQRGTVAFQVRSDATPFPNQESYTKNYNRSASPEAPSADKAEMQFHAAAARQLIEQGIEELLFIRRFTFTSNHVYTDYINSKWTPGGGLCVLNLKTGKVREIVPELTKTGVVNWFDLSFDAKKIVFDFKKGANDGYRIYEVNVDGTGLRQLTFPEPNEAELVKNYRRGYHHGTDDMDPCYLPDGGVAFVTTRCQFGVLCDSGDSFTVKNLYRMNGDGSAMKPLTYSPLSEATPTLLPDGRILYHRWEYVDKAAGNCKALWAVNPDGTGSVEIYGNTISFPETKIQARAVPDEPNKIVMLGASHWINNAVGTIILVDTQKPIRSVNTMTYVTDDVAAFAHDGFHFKDQNGKWYHERTGKPGRLFRNPYPLSSSLFLVSHKPAGLEWSDFSGYDIALLDGKGKETVLLKDPTISLWQPYPLVSREKPPVPTGMPTDRELAEKGLARCLVTDVYVGMDNVKRGEVKYLRILEQAPRSWSARINDNGDTAGMAHKAVGDGFLSVKVQHGIVPVEEDGSAHFLVPSDRPIYFQALDKEFRAIQTERTYVNYRPGETRSCVGCHETPDMTPSPMTSVSKAMQRAASIPKPQPMQPEAKVVFDYERQIQPILDKHCVECHTGSQSAAGLDLRGDPAGTYSVSYQSLIKLSKTSRQLLGNRKYRDEDNASNGIEYIPPYQTGALSSPLGALVRGEQKTAWNNEEANLYAEKLLQNHKDLKLSETEKLVVTNWLDVNCQYYPAYWGRKNEKFRDAPDFRPAFTFEEARSRIAPVLAKETETRSVNK
ncbi:MAG: NPCBM/NEW2 domain-containing protein [Planctomycetaceae bacterium]|nr:NPCBM/NEW2 domain-containing protein [Planctomycetaceae bacterium]